LTCPDFKNDSVVEALARIHHELGRACGCREYWEGRTSLRWLTSLDGIGLDCFVIRLAYACNRGVSRSMPPSRPRSRPPLHLERKRKESLANHQIAAPRTRPGCVWGDGPRAECCRLSCCIYMAWQLQPSPMQRKAKCDDDGLFIHGLSALSKLRLANRCVESTSAVDRSEAEFPIQPRLDRAGVARMLSLVVRQTSQ